MTSQWTNQGWAGDVEMMLQETLEKGERSGVTVQPCKAVAWPVRSGRQRTEDAPILAMAFRPSGLGLGTPFALNPTASYCHQSYHSFRTNQLTFSRPHFFLISDMSDQSGSSRLQALFELALRDYESTTNITLAKHPLAEKLQNCHSVETIIALLQDQAKGFCGSDRIMRSIGSTVSVLDQLSTITSLGGAIGLVRQKTLTRISHIADIFIKAFPPAAVIQAGLGVLLAVCAFLRLLLTYR